MYYRRMAQAYFSTEEDSIVDEVQEYKWRNIMSRNCPSCRAPIPETSIVCEYCGHALAVSGDENKKGEKTENKLESALHDANELLTKLKRYNQTSYKMIGIEHSTVDKAEAVARNLEVFAGDNKKVLVIVSEVRELIVTTNEKLKTVAANANSRKLMLTILYFIAIEAVVAVLIWLGNTVDHESLNTWLVGGLALIGGLIGIMGAVVGVIAGLIAGGLLGLLFMWLLSSLAGNIILFVIWNAIFVPLYLAVIRDKL